MRQRTATALRVVGLFLSAVLAGCSQGDSPVPKGVQSFEDLSKEHVKTSVSYSPIPPVGGRHFDQWQNCGFYDSPIANENAVHSLEHGAVWITYRPDLAPSDKEKLRSFVEGGYVLVSPYPGLDVPVVASAWGRQLRLDSADDPRLGGFLEVFRKGTQAPEPGAPCEGGVGQPQG